MAEIENSSEPAAAPTPPADGSAPPPPRRSPGHRGADVKDTVAEMAAKAHEISLEAGSKMAAAMKDVVNAAAGLGGFVIESARDLVQFMVRRGQMTQDEADKLLRQVEEHQPKRKLAPQAPLKSASRVAEDSHHARPAPHLTAPKAATTSPGKPAPTPVGKKAPPKKSPSATKAASKKPAAKKPAAKKAAPAKKSAAKKPVSKKSVPKKSVSKKPAARKPAGKAKRK